MSKQHYTQGPWVIAPIRLANGTEAFTILAPKEHGGSYEDEPIEVANIVSECDAHLVAAAPEMKDCIRWIAQTVHQAHHQEHGGLFSECPKSTCKHAAVVLAKAEGRNNE